jgi:hypothetical protein
MIHTSLFYGDNFTILRDYNPGEYGDLKTSGVYPYP